MTNQNHNEFNRPNKASGKNLHSKTMSQMKIKEMHLGLTSEAIRNPAEARMKLYLD
jgi:hypothetical protein